MTSLGGTGIREDGGEARKEQGGRSLQPQLALFGVVTANSDWLDVT